MRLKRGIALRALALYLKGCSTVSAFSFASFNFPNALLLITVLLSALLVIGCGAKEPPPKEPILLKISVTADEDINPSPRDRPSPLAVRVFELTDSGLFEESNYIELDANPKVVLEDTLLSAGDKVVVQPGKSVIIEREAHPETRVVGVTAGYRDIDIATWQGWHKVPAPPEAGWFSSPVRVRLDVRLHERIMEIIPAKK